MDLSIVYFLFLNFLYISHLTPAPILHYSLPLCFRVWVALLPSWKLNGYIHELFLDNTSSPIYESFQKVIREFRLSLFCTMPEKLFFLYHTVNLQDEWIYRFPFF